MKKVMKIIKCLSPFSLLAEPGIEVQPFYNYYKKLNHLFTRRRIKITFVKSKSQIKSTNHEKIKPNINTLSYLESSDFVIVFKININIKDSFYSIIYFRKIISK
jgi:hypothetical protein